MKTHEAELQRIKDLLRNNPKGMKITRIAGKLSMNRNAAAKFLEILLMTGHVEMFGHGMSKIFILSRRTGIPTMLDRSDDFILVLDEQMKITQVNDNYLRFAGIGREAVLGKRPDAAGLPVIGREPVFSRIREAHYGVDTRIEAGERSAGREFFFDVRMTPSIFNDGSRGIAIIASDITREKKHQQSLKESEENFRKLLGESPIGTAVFDHTGELTEANPAFLAAFRARTREGLAHLNLFSPEGVPPGARADLDAGKNVTFRYRTLLPGDGGDTGTSVLFEFLVTPVLLTNGGNHTVYLVQLPGNPVPAGSTDPVPAGDIRLVEEVLSCIDDAVVLVDGQSAGITFANTAAIKLFGYEKGELLGRDPVYLFGAGSVCPCRHGAPSGTIPQEDLIGGESRLRRKNGEDFPAHVQLRPICDEAGCVRQLVFIIRDLSGRRGPGPEAVHCNTWDSGVQIPARRLFPGPDRFGFVS